MHTKSAQADLPSTTDTTPTPTDTDTPFPPTNSPTPTETPTDTETPASTFTETDTPLPPTDPPTPTETPFDAETPTLTETVTPTPSPPTATPSESYTPTGTPTPGPPLALDLAPVASDFARPLLVTNAGDGSGRLFVVEQRGRIRIVDAGGTLLGTDFLDLGTTGLNRVSQAGSERGLLGMAFHPNYASNGRFFVSYTQLSDGASVIEEFSVSGNPNIADASSGQIVFGPLAQPQENHNGGHLAFHPTEGFLYYGLGDGGGAGDNDIGHTPGIGNGQDTNTLLGKLLRFDPDNGFAPPPSNPFFGMEGFLDEIYAYGLRNPWRFSFDRGGTHRLFLADVGQESTEEIDLVEAGDNLGWRRMEGSGCFNPSTGCQTGNLVLPIYDYGHTNGRVSVTGGYVYRGTAYPSMVGKYFFADFGTGEIWSLVETSPGVWEENLEFDAPFRISSFGEGEDGELYVCQFTTVPLMIHRLIDTNAAPTPTNTPGGPATHTPSPTPTVTGGPSVTPTSTATFSQTPTVTLSPTPSATIDNSGLVAYWRLDDGAGFSAADDTGNGNTGTLFGNPAWISGHAGGALDFDGVGDYASMGTNTFGVSAELSVLFWVRIDGTGAESFQGLVTRSGFVRPFRIEYTGSVINTSIRTAAGTNTLNSTTLPQPNLWHHVALTYKSGARVIYIDGQPNNSNAPTGNLVTVTGFATHLGARDAGSGLLNGALDDVRIYNRALSSSEVSAIFSGSPPPTSTPSASPTPSGTPTSTPTPSDTLTPAPPTPTFTEGPSPTPTSTATITQTPTVTPTPTPSPTIDNSGLVAYWRLDDGAGLSAVDDTGNGNTGTLFGNPAWISGHAGGALDFDGVGDYVNVGTNTFGISAELSVLFWVRIDGAGGESFQGLVTRSGFVRPFRIEYTGNVINTSIRTAAGTNTLNSTPLVPSNVWRHVALTYKSGSRVIYIDGQPNNSNAPTGNLVTVTGFATHLGARDAGSGLLNGALDEVRIYNRALSSLEVSAIFSGSPPPTSTPSPSPTPSGTPTSTPTPSDTFKPAPPTPTFTEGPSATPTPTPTITWSPTPSATIDNSGLMAYWKFDDGMGNLATDSSGNGITGTVFGGATWIPGQNGGALKFDGVDDYVDIGTGSFGLTSQMTLALWVRIDGTGPEVFQGLLVRSGFVRPFRIEVMGDQIQTGIRTTGTNFLTSNTHLDFGRWYHVALTYQSGSRIVYVDGLTDNSNAPTGNLVVPTNFATHLGARAGDTGSGLFNGALDDVRIYNRALSGPEVLALYQTVSTSTPGSLTKAGIMTGNLDARELLELLTAFRKRRDWVRSTEIFQRSVGWNP